MQANLVKLRCVTEGRKLRVKIISKGYNPNANCQFPRDIRVDGREYLVPEEDISFSKNAQMKFFYRVKKTNIQIVQKEVDISKLTVYEDEETTECCVCLSEEKDTIFYPCGHYHCCNDCAKKLKDCPICRTNIEQLVTKDQLQ